MSKEKRFVTVHREGGGFGAQIEVLMDTKTGVQYLYRSSGYSGGMTVLVDRDGKPLIGSVYDLEK
ncbi:MAG: xylan 1,4-beta-xylosidase [Oscillospiraceae bacterium]|nr:xylan 1,4-beta-xylosidase [Oscillospiraceae bacterium]